MNIISISGELPGFIVRLTSFDAEIGASEKKSHNQQNEWAIPIGIAHFQKEKDKSEFEKVSEWDTTIKDTMEEYDNVKR